MYRIGFSKDIHKIKSGMGIIMGGCKIDCPIEIDAYSDGDILLHSLCEALYGALGMGDLGTYFTEKDYPKNFSSLLIADDVKKHLKINDYKVENIDIMIVADKPSFKNHKQNIKISLCQIFEITQDKIAVKATTSDNITPNHIEVYSNVIIYKGEK